MNTNDRLRDIYRHMVAYGSQYALKKEYLDLHRKQCLEMNKGSDVIYLKKHPRLFFYPYEEKSFSYIIKWI